VRLDEEFPMQPTLPTALFLGSVVVLGAALAAPAKAQSLVRSVSGPAANAQFGKATIVVPDQNGDGYKDVVVGAPGFNQERGAIYCVSGAFLGTGGGASILWTCAPTANQGDLFGYAIADVGDATGDGVGDFLVGQPGYDTTSSNDRGAIRLVSGASHTVLSLISGFSQGELMGAALASTGDLDLDGRAEVLVGCPGTGTSTSRLVLFRGAVLSTSGFALNLTSTYLSDATSAELGAALAAGFDYDNAGAFASSRFLIGAPGFDAPGAADAGKVVVGNVTSGSISIQREYVSTTPGERMGASVDGLHDYDGDGLTDYIVGAPNSPNGTSFEVGRVVVLSGRRLLQQTPPFEILQLSFGGVTPPINHTDPEPNFHFGAAVRACADLNNDGVGEILIGAPDFFTAGALGGWNFRGLVRIYSGATGAQLGGITGGSTDRLGDGLGGALADLDGDGFKEFVIAGSRSDVGGTDSGVLKCYQLFPLGSNFYCTGKVNSLGCTPAMSVNGVASATSPAPFSVSASNFVNQKSGLLFYSHAPAAVLFQGGTKCVANPTIRTPPQSSGGAASGSSCTGVYALDFNSWLQSGADPTLIPGAEVFAQYWSRDPQAASHTSLSNAVRFVVHP
jgi:hypothetical protein